MFNNEIREKLIMTLDNIIEYGPKWKIGKAVQHFNKRAYHGHIPSDWSLENYNSLIISIANNLNNEAYLYYKDAFQKRYFVIGNKEWIVLVGEDEIMETAFPPNNYKNYLSSKDGYQFMGIIKEVRRFGL